ncbi:MAG TPA: hypothetical protein P5511_08440, partial [Candidatus Goldiibacteriota bacterium]|nr:hypothetical protein [Candidatus Goldiibacteriota bacterium]
MFFAGFDGTQSILMLQQDGSYKPQNVSDYTVTKNGNYMTIARDSEKRTYKYEFDAEFTYAKLVEISDRKGNKISLFYREGSVLETIIDSMGRNINIFYHASGKISAISYGQIEIKYYFDVNNRLTVVTGDRVSCNYEYTNDERKLLNYKNENRSGTGNEWVRYYYDADGRVIKTLAPEGTIELYYRMYDNGAYRAYAVSELQSMTRAQVLATFNAANPPFMTIVKNIDGTEEKMYYAANGFLQKTEKGGIITGQAAVNTSYTRPSSVTNENGSVTEYEYYADKRLYREIKKDVLVYGAIQANLVTEYTYDSNGFVSSVKDPRGNYTYFDRDNAGNIIQKREGNGLVVTDYVHYTTSHHEERKKINEGDIVVKDCRWDYSNENAIKYTERINGVLLKSTTYDRYGRVTMVESSGGVETRGYIDHYNGAYEVIINRPGRNDERQSYDRRG